MMNDGASMRSNSLAINGILWEDLTDDTSAMGLLDLVTAAIRPDTGEDTCCMRNLVAEGGLPQLIPGSTSSLRCIDMIMGNGRTSKGSAITQPLSSNPGSDIQSKNLFFAGPKTHGGIRHFPMHDSHGGKILDTKRVKRRRLCRYFDDMCTGCTEDSQQGYESDDSIDVGRRRMARRSSQESRARTRRSSLEQTLQHSMGDLSHAPVGIE